MQLTGSLLAVVVGRVPGLGARGSSVLGEFGLLWTSGGGVEMGTRGLHAHCMLVRKEGGLDLQGLMRTCGPCSFVYLSLFCIGPRQGVPTGRPSRALVDLCQVEMSVERSWETTLSTLAQEEYSKFGSFKVVTSFLSLALLQGWWKFCSYSLVQVERSSTIQLEHSVQLLSAASMQCERAII